ncbi:MAG TPA: PD-(D/E)XK nuclease family protein [Acidimicrobiales bacterium]|nr:PD-(D/E)XK nuclease family protein [Acidimicrobiales bacterium]
MPTVMTVRPGAAAHSALRRQIEVAKAGDALAPVTVAVPSPYAGLSLRRLLGSQPGALVNVAFLPLARIAELLGAPSLAGAGRRLLWAAERREALRVLLAGGGGLFGPIGGHPGTVRALDRTLTDLRLCPPEALARLEESNPRAAEVVSLHRRLRARLSGGWYDEHDLASAAADAVRAGSPALGDLGHVVLFCLRKMHPSAAALVEALGENVTVIEARADPSATPTGDVILGCADPDEEVRAALRGVMERVARPEPTPLHRMAILHPAGTPYAIVVHQQLDAAGIHHNGPAAHILAHTVTGRALLGLLDLAAGDLGRDELAGWLASAPIVEEADVGALVPTALWDSLSRRAGVVAGLAQWKQRLDNLVGDLRREATRVDPAGDEPDPGAGPRGLPEDPDEERRLHRRQRIERDIAGAERLHLFVEHLGTALDPGGPTTWAQLAGWATDLVVRYLGGPHRHRRWPEAEQRAFEEILLVLDGVGRLDAVGGTTDLAAFQHAVALELEAPAGRTGTFGDGVFVAPLGAAWAADFDTVFLLGMAEGNLPRQICDDALLPDRERRVAEGLALRADRQRDERADYLAALASASERVLLWPRADLGGGRQRLPSRWLLDTASRIAGRQVFSGDLAAIAARPDTAVHDVASFESGLREAGEPCSALDYDLAVLLEWKAAGGDVARHFLVCNSAPLAAGMAATAGRESAEFTRFDGKVPAGAASALAAGAVLSATSLQAYAECPLKYFLARQLGLKAEEKPEDLLTIGALERGTLVHAILEDYVSSLIEGRPRSLERLLEMAEARFKVAEDRGLTGRRVLWRFERQKMLRELERAHTIDAGMTPLAAELAFGMGEHEPVTLTLPNGRTIGFRGRADRVDRDGAGALVVTDYKTGGCNGYDAIDTDPVDRGTKLQLPLYGLAVRQRFPEVGAGTPVRSRYWMVSEKGGFKEFPIELTDKVLDRFGEVLGVIVDGITAGNFPARPGAPGWKTPENCRWCDMGSLCQEDRERQWERNKTDPALAAYVQMAEGESTDEGGAAGG